MDFMVMISRNCPFWWFVGRSTHCVHHHVMMYIPGVHTSSTYWDTSSLWVVTHHLSVVSYLSKWGFPVSQPTKWCFVHLSHCECRLTTPLFSLDVTHGQTFHLMVKMVNFHGGPSSYHAQVIYDRHISCAGLRSYTTCRLKEYKGLQAL